MASKKINIKVFTAFSGYDSQCMGLERLKENFDFFDYELVGWAEIDKPAIASHNAVFPEAADKNYGDISKVDWSKVPDFDLFTYSSPCFVKGTLVGTKRGLIPIEDVVVGDEVLTHTKTWHKVTETMVRKYSGELLHIKGMCINEIICTPEHPFYIREKDRIKNISTGGYNKILKEEPQWKNAKDLTVNDFLCYVINNDSELPKWDGIYKHNYGHNIKTNELNEKLSLQDFWYIVGRYIGDGWTRKTNHSIIICCTDKDIKPLTDAITNIGFNYTLTTGRTTKRVTINSVELYEFLERYNHTALLKTIDQETINLPVELLQSFIYGYKDSDGCTINDVNINKITTISEKLAFSISQCIAKAFNTKCRIYYIPRPEKYVIEGREVNQHNVYQVVWDNEPKKSHVVYDENCIWYPIRSIEKETVSDINVYNLEVEEDHSYNVYYTVVHNCQDFSICGTQKGGLSGTGTRSSLLWECQRTIEQKRPKFLLLENVKALYEDHIFRPLLYAWKDTVDSYGYKSWIKVLNSDDYDIPQGRERVFMVSIRTDAGEPNYFWPKEMQRTRTINDFLKWETPEEYYLDDKKFSKFYDLLTNAGAWFNDTTTEHKHLVDGKERVIKRRRYTIKEEDEKEENKSSLF